MLLTHTPLTLRHSGSGGSLPIRLYTLRSSDTRMRRQTKPARLEAVLFGGHGLFMVGII